MTEHPHGIGMQQHSNPSHSMHFVLVGSVPAGLPIDVIEEEEEVGMMEFVGRVREACIFLAVFLYT